MKDGLIYLGKPMSWNQWENKCKKEEAEWIESNTPKPVEVKVNENKEFGKEDLRRFV